MALMRVSINDIPINLNTHVFSTTKIILGCLVGVPPCMGIWPLKKVCFHAFLKKLMAFPQKAVIVFV